MRSTHDYEDRIRYWLTDAVGGGLPIPDKVFMIMSRPNQKSIIVPNLSRKRGTLKLIRPSVSQSVCLSVTKTLTWLKSSEVLKIEH